MSEMKGDSIQSVISGWLETGEYSDVTFQIGPEREELKAHKIILASRSPVFKAMFSECWDRCNYSSKGIEILDTDIQTLRFLLKFLYTDKLDEKEVPQITKLLYLADKYDVQVLLPKCDQVLMSRFDLQNSLELHQVTELKGLLAWIEEQITTKFDQFSQTQTFLDIEETELMGSLLKRDDLSIEEVDLFRAVVRWGQASLNKNDGERGGEEKQEGNESLQSILEDMLPLVRFPTMSSADFAFVVRPTKLLPSKGMFDVYIYLASTGIERRDNKPVRE